VKSLSVGVAIAAAIALVAGITEGGVDVLGLAADATLLSIGAVGLVLSLTTFRSSLISPFLRVFSTIFAVEYVVTALDYVAGGGLVASKLGGSRAARKPSHHRRDLWPARPFDLVHPGHPSDYAPCRSLFRDE